MNIIVVGCGRVGSQLATRLSNNGQNVCIIDKKQEAFASLGQDFSGRSIVGLGFDEKVLEEADIETCDALAAVTNLDNSNLMTAEVARKIYHVPHVITRLYSPERESAYLQLGLDYVCGTTLVAEDMFSKIQSGRGHHLDTFGDYEIARFSLDLSQHAQQTMKVSALERAHDIRVAAYEHNGQTAIPNADTVLHNGDILMAAIDVTQLATFSRFMKN